MTHLPAAVFLVVNFDRPTLKPDIACIPLSLVFVHGHERLFPTSFESGSHAIEIDREIRIPIQHKEFLAEEWQRFLQCSSRAEECWPIEGIIDFHSEVGPVSKIALDHFAEVSNA